MLKEFAGLSTPVVADACVRLGVELRAAPVGVVAVTAGGRVAGRVLPVRHYGSVDVFLEAYGAARDGEVLETAAAIARTERAQAERIAAGDTLRRQTAFDAYLERRAADPSYSFRQHLRRVGGAIEE
ncbi:hypothetical protein P3T27_002829 [Kitasatospora sp. MAA19]|uniref:hypothetical protein n=1 Tax=Kitasatospora sp. MAA19 TaxID=3035090 RepID=UPI00247606DD|nr:hypothetical protein [Kitasatospora sp. MAA19]MDH6706106.1 hypothetical protein [Kitasatospora sp. MAA19]